MAEEANFALRELYSNYDALIGKLSKELRWPTI